MVWRSELPRGVVGGGKERKVAVPVMCHSSRRMQGKQKPMPFLTASAASPDRLRFRRFAARRLLLPGVMKQGCSGTEGACRLKR